MSYFLKQIVVGPLEANCYLFGDSDSGEAVIIDPGGSPEKIKNFLEECCLRPKCVVDTHGHIDHIAANDEFGMPVWIHTDDAEFLTNNKLNLADFCGLFYQGKAPGRLLNDGDTIEAGELQLEVIHTPGHTPGGICLKCEDVLFTGDTLFAGGIGRSDFPYASEDTLLKSIREKLLTLDNHTKIYPGHGGQSTIGRELASNPFIRSL